MSDSKDAAFFSAADSGLASLVENLLTLAMEPLKYLRLAFATDFKQWIL